MGIISMDSGYKAIVGLGKTGLSCAHFFRRHGVPFVICDSRDVPPLLGVFEKAFPDVVPALGAFDSGFFAGVDEVVVSPGVALSEPALVEVKTRGVSVVGDVDVFVRHARAPVVAITGSNGKSTVTSLVAEMAKAAGVSFAVGGNLGTPALDFVDDDVRWFILELSSFQLEGVGRLGAKVACVLNVGEDHLDRYESLDDYVAAKFKVFEGAECVVVNRDDPSACPVDFSGRQVSFGLDAPDDGQFGVVREGDAVFLAFGVVKLVDVKQLKLVGSHNWANALAALAFGSLMGFDLDVCVKTVKGFAGLPHRCQWVASFNEVAWYDDSKGTNVSATCCSVASLAEHVVGDVVLLAGGQGKGADFFPLRNFVGRPVKHFVLFGEDAQHIAQAVGEVHCSFVGSMDEAVEAASQLAVPGDAVLLSPACASFDMFADFADRGVHFRQAVLELGS